jgi:hypothetical protein
LARLGFLDSVGHIVAPLPIAWLCWGYCGSVGNVVALLGTYGGAVADDVTPFGMWVCLISWECDASDEHASDGSVGNVMARLGM